MRKRPVADQLALRFGRPVGEIILDRLREGNRWKEIAALFNVEQSTVKRWADDYGIRQDWVRDDSAAAP